MTILFTYLFWQSRVCYVNGYPRRHNVIYSAWFVNMVFSDEHKIPIKIYSWRDITWYSWGQNFRTKDGRQAALTDCWRSSETRAQWTNVRTATDREVPAPTKHWPGERHGSESKRTNPEFTAQSVKYHGRQAFLSYLLSASYTKGSAAEML